MGVLQKALDVLEHVVGEEPMTLGDASRVTGLGKAAVYRILNTFEARQYLIKEPTTRRYHTGPALLALAATVTGKLDLVEVARPAMAALRDASGETVNLGVAVGDHVEYLAMLESPHSLRMASRPGSVDALHCTALGKAILAWLPRIEAEALAPQSHLMATTPNTITDWEALSVELQRTRNRGWSIDEEENEVGARCIAAPILGADGRPLAALSVSGPASRMTPEKVLRVAAELTRLAGEISQTQAVPVRRTNR